MTIDAKTEGQQQQQMMQQAFARDLSTLRAEVWLRLGRGVVDRRATARHPTLATVSPDGWPQARTVVLRAVDPVAGTLDIHSDIRAAKVKAIADNGQAALHVWEAGAHLQIRIEASAVILTGDSVAAIWAKVPEASRSGYGVRPAPGEPITEALGYDKTPDQAAFAVVRLTVHAIDALHLGHDAHRRGRFLREDGWSGQWLAP